MKCGVQASLACRSFTLPHSSWRVSLIAKMTVLRDTLSLLHSYISTRIKLLCRSHEVNTRQPEQALEKR